jgi:nucleotide-binding universal stress UspA family protein
MRILYATDGLAPAVAAGRLLEAVADRASVEVTVLSVATLEIFIPEDPTLLSEDMELRRARALQIATDEAGRLREAGFSARSEVAEGSPGAQIVRVAGQGSYDLVVVGARKRSPIGRLLGLGTNAEHVLASAGASVLVVREAPLATAPVRVLVGTDGSACAERALEAFLRFADPRRCTVRVVSVACPSTQVPIPGGLGDLAGVSEASVKDQHRRLEEAWEHATRAARRLGEHGFPAEQYVVAGAPESQLRSEAESGSYDLVVVGSRGLSRPRAAFLGSVSRALATHARAALIGRVPSDLRTTMPPEADEAESTLR